METEFGCQCYVVHLPQLVWFSWLSITFECWPILLWWISQICITYSFRGVMQQRVWFNFLRFFAGLFWSLIHSLSPLFSSNCWFLWKIIFFFRNTSNNNFMLLCHSHIAEGFTKEPLRLFENVNIKRFANGSAQFAIKKWTAVSNWM